ncbi:TPA: hypothetical protein UMZ04_001120 [Stenotrophomonas maltophilia]|jgi:hypothetical protein|nr:hypothetical protein [Stenotrophomonas maltophilia]HEL3845516.1 hypothetical protein [Stenotrophomonas maltophilia]HEL4292547.1 hypothetical protein [Stenotrophomonas maltophilia]
MYATFIAAVLFLLATVTTSVAVRYEARTEAMKESRARVEQTRIAEALFAYREQFGRLPDSLDQLASSPGYEQLRSYRNEWQRYMRASDLSDGTWRFERAASWTVARRDGANSVSSENSCGAGDFTTAASWCGPRDGVWHRLETRELFSEEIAQEKLRQRRTLQLFSDYWTTRQAFPRVSASGQQLGNGQMLPLPVMAGYAGTADSCSGVHVWMGIPLDCAALFDVWGSPVGYQYQSDTYVILASEAPFSAADGRRVIVASPLNIQG